MPKNVCHRSIQSKTIDIQCLGIAGRTSMRCHPTEKLSRRCALPKLSKCTRSRARSRRLQRRVGRPRAGAGHRRSRSWLRLTVTDIFWKVFLLPDMTSTTFRSTLPPASRCCSCVATRAMPLAPQAPPRVIAVYRRDLTTAVPWPLLVWCGAVAPGSCEEWARHPI